MTIPPSRFRRRGKMSVRRHAQTLMVKNFAPFPGDVPRVCTPRQTAVNCRQRRWLYPANYEDQ
jgi:hypothetical protein